MKPASPAVVLPAPAYPEYALDTWPNIVRQFRLSAIEATLDALRRLAATGDFPPSGLKVRWGLSGDSLGSATMTATIVDGNGSPLDYAHSPSPIRDLYDTLD